MTAPELAHFAGADTTAEAAAVAAQDWVDNHVPGTWRAAAEIGGAKQVRRVRTPEEYRAWYPVFGASGMVASGWELEYGGLSWSREAVKAAEAVLGRYHLPRLNPLGINNAAPALFAFGTEEQKQRFLPPIVRAEELWCQLFSEPGAGSDLASLATRAELDGDSWVITGSKIWTTWADSASFGVLLARTDFDVPKHQGITYFLLDMRQPGVDVRPLTHMGGETEFFQVFLDEARVADSHRLGEPGQGWKVAQSTLSGERQMVAGASSGGVDRIGGAGTNQLIRLARRIAEQGGDGWNDPVVRDRLVHLYAEERVRSWTNRRVRSGLAAGRAPGAESSIGKVHQADLNQRIQEAAADLLGMAGLAWAGDASAEGDPAEWARDMPAEVRGMLRSRANTIEGGTTEVNRNVLAERVLGLPKEPDPWKGKPWRELPRG